MPWFSRFSRFGDLHFVYTQQGDNACGIASVVMCVFKVNKLAPGAQAVVSEQAIYGTYSGIAGAPYDGTAYSSATKLDQTLNALNCGKWKAEYIGPTKVADRLISICGDSGLGPTVNVSPVIVLVGWNKGGAHFVVVDTVRTFLGTTYATVCDPWDGQLRVITIASGTSFDYQSNDTFHWNWKIEGTPEHEYAKPSSGVANGWVINQI